MRKKELDKDTQNKHNDNNYKCDGFDIKKAIQTCQVVGPPTSYDLPVHPFFLTSYHTVVEEDVTVYTMLSIDRLGRLVEMAENWNGPVSAAISITDVNEIPKIMEAWMGNDVMRKYVDVHLVFDDEVLNNTSKGLRIAFLHICFFALTPCYYYYYYYI